TTLTSLVQSATLIKVLLPALINSNRNFLHRQPFQWTFACRRNLVNFFVPSQFPPRTEGRRCHLGSEVMEFGVDSFHRFCITSPKVQTCFTFGGLRSLKTVWSTDWPPSWHTGCAMNTAKRHRFSSPHIHQLSSHFLGIRSPSAALHVTPRTIQRFHRVKGLRQEDSRAN